MDSGLFSQYFAYKRYFNTIIGPWDLSRIVDNGRLYILTEYNVFWTGLARSGPVRRVWIYRAWALGAPWALGALWALHGRSLGASALSGHSLDAPALLRRFLGGGDNHREGRRGLPQEGGGDYHRGAAGVTTGGSGD